MQSLTLTMVLGTAEGGTMRLATITNWAYGATVCLTVISGATMLLASRAYKDESAAVEQRYELDKSTTRLEIELLLPTDHARQYLNTGDPTYKILYARDLVVLRSIEDRLRHLRDAGANSEEIASLKEAISWTEALHDEQAEAVAAHSRGDEALARQILFGPEYERNLDRAKILIDRFEDRLDQRTESQVKAASQLSGLWKTVSEIVLATTGLLFLFVLSFVFKRRVLKPVLRLSDVVSRLAAQDYAVEPPAYDQIDEIGDMAQAIRVFRENGIERQRLEEEREADFSMRDLLSTMTQRMQGCDTLTDLKEVVRRFVPEIVPTLAGRLYLLDDRRSAVVEACNWLEPQHSRAEFAPIACWALRRGLPHQPAGDTVDVPCEHLDLHGAVLAGTLCLPLMAQRETLGLLYFEPRAGLEGKTERPEIYLRMLAENIGLALANLKLRDVLREMAMADPLTGLANRRRLEMVLEARLDEAERLGRSVSCLMIDVDHFKRFNDGFGHDAGDAVLREVGAVLRNSTRDDDLAFRYGGEEFLVLLPDLSPEQARIRGEEIRVRIDALRIVHNGSELGPISASIGVASAPANCSSGEIVQAADVALLRAKAQGRDRVEVAGATTKASAA